MYAEYPQYQKNINMIEGLCNDLDWLASPDIEETMVCDLECCTGNVTWPRIERMIDDKEMQSILGDTGIDLLRQLCEKMGDAIYYDDEKGFSKKQRWLDFVDFVNKVNIFLKDSVKKYKANN